MTQVMTIIAREYMERVKKRSFLIGTVLGPLLMIAMILVPMLIAGTSTRSTLRVAVVDQTESLYPFMEKALGDTLGSGRPKYALERIAATLADGDILPPQLAGALETESADIVLILPRDIREGGEARFYSKKVGDFDIMRDLRAALTQLVVRDRLEGQGLDPGRITELTQAVQMKTYKISGGEAREEGFMTDFVGGWIFMMILYATLIMYGATIQRSIIEEKGSRIIEVLLSATTPLRMMWGKILGVGSVALTQYAIWAVFGIVATTVASSRLGDMGGMAQVPASTFVYFVVFFVLGYFLYSCLFASVGAMVNSEQEAQQLQGPIVLLLVIPMVLGFSVPKDPSGPLATILSLIPFFAPLIMFMRISVYPPPAHEVALSIGLMILTIVGLVFLTARVYRVGILMYGKRPTLPELARWIRRS